MSASFKAEARGTEQECSPESILVLEASFSMSADERAYACFIRRPWTYKATARSAMHSRHGTRTAGRTTLMLDDRDELA